MGGGGKVSMKGGEKERGLRGAINGHFNGSIKRYQSVPLCRPYFNPNFCLLFLFVSG